jgi:hypothetical protein
MAFVGISLGHWVGVSFFYRRLFFGASIRPSFPEASLLFVFILGSLYFWDLIQNNPLKVYKVPD